MKDIIKENRGDIESIIEAVIPLENNGSNPIWNVSAREILRGILQYCLETDSLNSKQVRSLIELKPKNLVKLLEDIEGTETAIGFLTSSEMQSLNYISNLKRHIRTL